MAKYVCKAEPTRSDEASDNRQFPEHGTAPKKGADLTLDQYARMKIADVLNGRRISLFEACWFNQGLDLVRMTNAPISGSISGSQDSILPVYQDLDGPDDDSRNVSMVTKHVFYGKRPAALESMCYADFCCTFDGSDSRSGSGQVIFHVTYFKKGETFTRFFRAYNTIKTLSYNVRAPNTNNTDKSLYIFFHPWRS